MAVIAAHKKSGEVSVLCTGFAQDSRGNKKVVKVDAYGQQVIGRKKKEKSAELIVLVTK